MTDKKRVRVERQGHVTVITLDRAEKRNAFDLRMLGELAEAYTAFEDDRDARCAIVRADGGHFTAGLDLAEVGPAVAQGAPLFPAGSVDPLSLGRARTKPVVMAARGYCLTIGIELMLASDVRIAADDARFGQIEVNRGIFPFGGATIRMPLQCGWGNAMRWLLTGDLFDAREALRIGLVQEVTDAATLDERVMAIATSIASRAPLGVTATLASSRIAVLEGEDAAKGALLEQARTLMASEDAAEGLRSFIERREARFTGK
jgi:enoyl-CoA hydratase